MGKVGYIGRGIVWLILAYLLTLLQEQDMKGFKVY
jgi:hypothetical protein